MSETEIKKDNPSPYAAAQGADVGAQEPPAPRKGVSPVVKFLAAIVIVFAAAWLMRLFVFSPYEIPSGSMEDTIMVGDFVFAEKVTYATGGKPQPGDIVTFIDPNQDNRTLIKRVIATEGQEVDLIDGRVYVDGEPLDEPYVSPDRKSFPLSPAPGLVLEYPYTVPAGHIWVMGDNRTQSQDSRYFGAVPVSSVTGHANFRYWPLDRAGALK